MQVEFTHDKRAVTVTTKDTAPGGRRTEKVGLPYDPDLFDHMTSHGVVVEVTPEELSARDESQRSVVPVWCSRIVRCLPVHSAVLMSSNLGWCNLAEPVCLAAGSQGEPSRKRDSGLHPDGFPLRLLSVPGAVCLPHRAQAETRQVNSINGGACTLESSCAFACLLPASSTRTAASSGTSSFMIGLASDILLYHSRLQTMFLYQYTMLRRA